MKRRHSMSILPVCPPSLRSLFASILCSSLGSVGDFGHYLGLVVGVLYDRVGPTPVLIYGMILTVAGK
jgi:hypothetical protein